MIGILIRAASLAAVYLLVLTSLKPGDVAMGALLGLALAIALRPRDERARDGAGGVRLRAACAVLWRTFFEVLRGSWRTVRFCLSGRGAVGEVELPLNGRSRHNIALWAVLTGESPDEVVVDVDHERDVMIVHVVGARDADEVRRNHRENEAAQRELVP